MQLVVHNNLHHSLYPWWSIMQLVVHNNLHHSLYPWWSVHVAYPEYINKALTQSVTSLISVAIVKSMFDKNDQSCVQIGHEG